MRAGWWGLVGETGVVDRAAGTRNHLFLQSAFNTELQVVLAMARNLSIGTESKIDPKGGKKCIKVPKNVSNRIDFCSTIRTRRESQRLPYAGFFWMASLRFLPNLRHVDNFKSIRELYFPVESHETFYGHSGLYNPSFKPLSRNSWMAEVDFFITTTFQTVVRGAQDHPTCNMISRFVP